LYSTDADKYREQYKLLHDIAGEISIAAGIPTPEVVIITDTDPNAFAVGIRPENSYIMVTTGMISTLNREELQGVIAHEMSHIRNNDTELMTVITVLFGGILLLADWMKKIVFWNAPTLPKIPGFSIIIKFVFFIFWILAVLFAPIIARILAMSVSRKREYLADAGAAELTRNPLALANALEIIENRSEPTRSVPKSIAHLCIIDPLGRKINNKEGFWSDIFATHPPIQKRIMVLRSMAYQG
jgi:heat shock protein HtpX